MKGKHCTSSTNMFHWSFEELFFCWVISAASWSASGIYVMLFFNWRKYTCSPSKNKMWILSRYPFTINCVCIKIRTFCFLLMSLTFRRNWHIPPLLWEKFTHWLVICRTSNHPFLKYYYWKFSLSCNQWYFGDATLCSNFASLISARHPVHFSFSVVVVPRGLLLFWWLQN